MPLFRPLIAGATWSGRLIGCIGGLLGIALTALITAQVMPASALPALIAAIGGSAALVFAIPSSPLAQPWPVIGGNTMSTLVGIAAFHAIPNVALASGVAVGGAMIAMSLLRCFHPPGGATALTGVIGGPAVHASGYAFAFLPVATSSLALVIFAAVFLRATGHAYPHRATPTPMPASNLDRSDIDAALAEMHESFDIARDDLDALLARAEIHAAARRRR
jgi:CBS domain-containing membrane protein